MKDKVNKYLTEQFISLHSDTPDDECIDEAKVIVGMVTEKIREWLETNGYNYQYKNRFKFQKDKFLEDFDKEFK